MHDSGTDNTEGRTERDRALFDSIAHQYMQKDLAPSSRIARRQRLIQTLKPCAALLARQPNVLEVGCGAGFSADYLRSHYMSYTGIDYSEELIRYACANFRDSNVAFHAVDFHCYETTARYDIIMMIGVLHHMTDIDSVLHKCKSLLNPGGYLVANEPQPDNPLIHGMRRLRAKLDSGYSAEQEELTSAFVIGEYEKAGFREVASVSQGYISTPFAEVVLKPQFLFHPLSKVACGFDRFVESKGASRVSRLAWNTIVYGKNVVP